MAKKKSTRRTFGSMRIRNGKYQASYKRNGKTYYAPSQFTTRTEAQAWLNNEESLMLKGTWTEPNSPTPLNTTWTLGSFAMHHIDVQTTSRGVPLKASTKDNYYSYLRRGLASLAHLDLEDITVGVVDKWYAGLCKGGKITTASKHYKLLHAVMGRALAEGYIAGPNPCQVKGAQNASTNVPIRTLSMREVGLLSKAINPRFRRQVLIMANSGLRFGEATALVAGDINFADSNGSNVAFLDVERAVMRLKDRSIVVGPPKSEAGNRRMPLHSDLTQLVVEQLDMVNGQSELNLLFPSASGTFLRNDVFNKALKEAAVRAGMEPKGISAHCLRRTGATELANTGANIAEVQEYLGDASEKAALRYIKPTGRTQLLIERMSTGLEFA